MEGRATLVETAGAVVRTPEAIAVLASGNNKILAARYERPCWQAKLASKVNARGGLWFRSKFEPTVLNNLAVITADV